jgi:hypothetical protein
MTIPPRKQIRIPLRPAMSKITRKPVPRTPIEEVDLSKFEYSSVRPPPPLICLKENRPAFESEAKALLFLEEIGMGSNLKELWTCNFCSLVHHKCNPIEASGSSSGKNTRKEQGKKDQL